ncbi:MAG: hypothetical protein DWQ47_07745 [Acidobacteria bacterium]|nr:MAG: hypothetical protein DWQ32_15845 [Acidobacteriota bacterium]REJ99187.1 MAG: hypothetical protein DWQ38_14130 [Acidobacteriota bacterium]REK16092.1 MAG: hypothetical protein DWQ43_03555 [Acidobacteriota bacterium]REK43773.1 MAG: hypothetical protein DWQ47_07745 [Acidobacteriota bacterium]
MNSEELEQSLRAEFDGYLKDVFSDIKQEISGFQEKLDSEFKEHRERVNAALAELSGRFSDSHEIGESFRDSVTEHLRLAKDEGARITAMAIAEAEELHGSATTAEDLQEGFLNLRDAISDITRKESQAEILKSLVHHAAEYTPRGAFFIVKSEHLVGWRVFGREDHDGPDVVRELFFPLASRTALSEAVESLGTVNGLGEGGADEDVYLNRLGFGRSPNVVAIPLVARGRGVAVLYADSGENGGFVNTEALETLVHVAGLTVELLASAASDAHESHDEYHVDAPSEEDYPESSYRTSDFAPPAYDEEDGSPDEEVVEPVEAVETIEKTEFEAEAVHDLGEADGPFPAVAEEEPAVAEESFSPEESADESFEDEDQEEHATGFSFSPSEPFAAESSEEGYSDDLGSENAEPAEEAEPAHYSADEFADTFEPSDDELKAEQRFDAEVDELYDVSDSVEYVEPQDVEEVTADAFEDAVEVEAEPEEAFAPVQAEEEEDLMADEARDDEERSSFEYSSLEDEAERAEAAYDTDDSDDEEPAEEPEPATVVTESAAVAESGSPARSRFGDRNIDLPIEVAEDERQYHNAARRFARLLVSEIKLYNEQKVKEGCEANDLYERLREAIDRSREMYEKRVHGPVAEKFDYFNFELVNNLAQGDESKLGGSYPGSKV